MTEATAVTWLTQEAYDRLKAELADMSGPRRTEIAARIAAARDEGDLKENGGYHAAREEQGKLEARIRELTEKLRNVQIGTPADDGVVEPGMVVTAVVAGDEMRFLLGSREIAGGTDIDVYSPTSPMGAAIIGHAAGDRVTYTAPNGREIGVEIVEATPFTG
jgi:transcription elongation factor GreA